MRPGCLVDSDQEERTLFVPVSEINATALLILGDARNKVEMVRRRAGSFAPSERAIAKKHLEQLSAAVAALHESLR
jgi:hypothetical protein